MSTFSELGNFPPSPEVQREMALTQIRFFQASNANYRRGVAMVQSCPSSKRIAKLHEVCEAVKNGAEPMVETYFFRDIKPSLVEKSVNALLDEVVQNRELACSLDGESYEEHAIDDEFRRGVVERILENDPDKDEDNDEFAPIVVFNPLEELSVRGLIRFAGSLHRYSVGAVFESLENSEAVAAELEKEYLRQERTRTAVIGLVAFAGALGGSLAASRINKRR
jgi:hypothetical protein